MIFIDEEEQKGLFVWKRKEQLLASALILIETEIIREEG